VSLTVANSTEVADLVESGDVESGFVESPTVRPTLHRRRIGRDHLVVAVAASHPWTRRQRISPQDLSSAPLLVREARSGTRDTIERALRSRGLHLDAGLETASNTALKSAAIAGMGPVVVSALAVADEVARGQLHLIDVEGLDLQRPLSVIWRREIAMSSAAKSLLKAVTMTTRADERYAPPPPQR
jgi:DNA-binding transcriptional LysR family regulator